jgi:glycosyltransferase involved in cell wall biosynthesis
MRVAFVNQSGDELGGAEHSLALLLRSLPDQVHPRAILFNDGAFAQRLRDMGIEPYIIPLPGALTAVKRERFIGRGAIAAPAAVAALARAIATIAPDIVYTNTVKAHLLATPAARVARVPAVAHLRDILEGPARTMLRAVLGGCTRRRVAISGAVRDTYRLPKTAVIPNPLDLHAYATLPSRGAARDRLGLPHEGTLVTIIGRINRWKGHDRFVRVAAALREHPDLRFAIVGAPVFRDEDFAGELHEQVRALALEDRVHFIPWMDDARYAYAATDVIANCSDSEPFGRTLIEAAACGVPAVCFDSGGTSEAVRDGETGYVVPARDETRFTEAVQRLTDDAALRTRFASAGRAFAQNFDASTHARRVTDVLKSTLA